MKSTSYELPATDLMTIKRALEFYTQESKDSKRYLENADRLHQIIHTWYIDALRDRA